MRFRSASGMYKVGNSGRHCKLRDISCHAEVALAVSVALYPSAAVLVVSVGEYQNRVLFEWWYPPLASKGSFGTGWWRVECEHVDADVFVCMCECISASVCVCVCMPFSPFPHVRPSSYLTSGGFGN